MEARVNRTAGVAKLVIYSVIGIVLFFLPITLFGKKTILFDHAVSYLTNEQKTLSIILVLALIIYGVYRGFFHDNWRQSKVTFIFSCLKVLGLLLAVMYLTNTAPDLIMTKDKLPFLFEKLALSVGLIVPIGAAALTFLVGFGLLELIGVLMQPVMKPIWRTPGYSAIDAVASFVGSYSIGLLITNRVYLQGKYSPREAAIVATGFSTVSAAFLVIVAKTLGLMESWLFFFWSTLIITFLVTAISSRIPPISLMSGEKTDNSDVAKIDKSRYKVAIDAGISTAQNAKPLWKLSLVNIKDGINMSAAIVPSILSVGLIGLLLAQYTPVFDWLGWILRPFSWLGGLPDVAASSKALASGLAEMFLPAIMLKDADILTRYTAGVVSISSILFFSASIPCVMATKIPLKLTDMMVIWFIRAALSIVLAAYAGKLAIYFGWL